jgi:hypothetical protein
MLSAAALLGSSIMITATHQGCPGLGLLNLPWSMCVLLLLFVDFCPPTLQVRNLIQKQQSALLTVFWFTVC